MAGRNGDNKLSRNATARRRRAGMSATAGAFVAGAAMATGSVFSAAPAEADILTDILDPVIAPLVTAMADAFGAVDPTAGADLTSFLDSIDPSLALPALDPAAAVLPAIDPFQALEQDWITSPLGIEVDNAINSLFGSDVVGTSAAPAAAAASAAAASTPTNFDVPLSLGMGTEPTVNLAVNGGSQVPVLVDTGSTGLVIPFQDIGWWNLGTLGFPTNIGFSGYSGGVDYVYLTFDTTVSFDNAAGTAVTTSPTAVDVPILSWPTAAGAPLSFGQFLQDNGVQGILGIGVNAGGPGTTSPLTALPGDLNQGALINVPGNQLVFGPNPFVPEQTVSGAPIANLQVAINGGTPQTVSGDIDSGGVYGTIPSSVVGNLGSSGTLPPNTEITVSTSSGQVLYSYYTTATNSPYVTSGNTLDTGYVPFSLAPIYIDYSPAGTGTTIFDSMTPVS